MDRRLHHLRHDASNHAFTAKTYADTTARDADTAWHKAANLHKVVFITDISAFHVMMSVGPAVWQAVGTVGATALTSTVAELNILDGVTAVAAELNYLDLTDVVGIAEASKAIVLDADKRLVWATTSDATIDPISFTSTMTGAGTTGGRALFRLNAEAALGGWSNALKAHVVYGATAKTTGLGSAFVAELQLSAGTVDGTYAPIEAELVVTSGGSLGTMTSFLNMNVADDGTTFNDGGYLLSLGGIVSATDGLFEAEAKSTIAKTHTLKIQIEGTDYFIALHTSKAFGGS